METEREQIDALKVKLAATSDPTERMRIYNDSGNGSYYVRCAAVAELDEEEAA